MIHKTLKSMCERSEIEAEVVFVRIQLIFGGENTCHINCATNELL